MLKKIPAKLVCEGMFVHKFCGSWLQHPFWSSQFLIKDAATAEKIRQASIKEVVIDLSKGCDLPAAATVTDSSAQADTVSAAEPARGGAEEEGAVCAISMQEEIRRAREVFNRGKEAVVTLFADARLGRTIETAGLSELIDDMSASIARNSHALISVARIKNKDEYTYLHSVAVAAMMIGLARQLELDEASTRLAGLAGLLHDMGKAVTPEAILNKPGKLTDDEFDVMRQHPVLGHQLLQAWYDAPEEVLDVCLHHHEKVDGSGYPERLAGDQISLLARMGAVCDVYDAITSNRPYKEGWDPAVSITRMTSWKGHFDPPILQAFVRMLGIYPVGSLVKLASNHLAVVVEQNPQSLLTPDVNVFYSVALRQPVSAYRLALGDAASNDRIVSRENPEDWGLKELEKLWLVD